MTILDTFYILFKSNAKDVNKDMADAEKATKNFQEEINKTEEVTSALSESLIKVGLKGIEAFTTFEGLKTGITDAINFNAALEKTHIITGANSKELAAYDATFAQFGSNSGNFLAWFTEASKAVAQTNGDISHIIPNLKNLADQLKNLKDQGNEKEARQLFQIRAAQIGLPQDFYYTLIQGSQALDIVYQKQKALQDVTEETTAAGLKLESEFKELGSEIISAFTPLLPVMNFILFILKEIILSVKSLTNLLAALGNAAAGNFSEAAKDFQKFKDTGKQMSNVAKEELIPQKDLSSNQENNINNEKENKTQNFFSKLINKEEKEKSSDSLNKKEESRKFWLSKGYTPQQTSALLATEQAESNFNERAIGDNGKAAGIFQWHPDRRNKILENIGIDVATASHEDQLKAAAWELKQRGDEAKIKETSTPDEAASVITKQFERPADILGQSKYRGMLANKDYNQTSGYNETLANAQKSILFADSSNINSLPSTSNNNSTININSIVVNSQATDANGIAKDIHGSLSQQLAFLTANINDGIAK